MNISKCLVLTALALTPVAKAASVSIPIMDLGTFEGYTAPSNYETSNSTGFYGMYSDELAHLFGLESDSYSRTVAQANIGFLNGATISSATLSFVLGNGSSGTQDIQLTGFDSGGTLGHTWDAPGDNLGQGYFSVTGLSLNVLDLTMLVQMAADANIDWLGLHLQGTSEYQWTYTYSGYDAGADSAQVRLNIEFEGGEGQPVPEVQTYATLVGAGLIAAQAIRRRKARA